MTPNPVKRCVAVAAHGKRCQQTPFRGSPYCWHHTRSRKVWAPSRRAAPLQRAMTPTDGAAVVLPEPTVAERIDLVVRLVEEFGTEATEALLAFLEDRRDGSLTIVKQGGQVVDLIPERHHGARRRAER